MTSWHQWLEERTGWFSAGRRFLEKPMPVSLGWQHVLGSALLTALLVQFVTGAAMLLYYAPTPDHALASVAYIEAQHFGAWVRGMHVWGASLAVVLALLHLGRVFIDGAFRTPREVTWLLGVALFFVLLAFGFTGYLLPWDQKAYWATVVGTEVMRTVPLVGDVLARLVRGGDEVGALTLTRFFATHVVLLPTACVLLVVGHLALLRRHGPHTDPARQPAASEPFGRRQFRRDATVAVGVVVVLVALAILRPPELGEPADPSDTDFLPRPEWYFLPLFQLLKVFEGPWEVVGTTVLPGLGVLALAAWPWLGNRLPGGRRGRATLFGIMVAALGVLTLRARDGDPPAAIDWDNRARPLELVGSELAEEYGCLQCHTGAATLETPFQEEFDWRVAHYDNPAGSEETGVDEAEAMALEAWTAALAAGRGQLVAGAPEIERTRSRALFDQLCLDCHAVGGLGGENGPALDSAGHHSRAWLRQQILQPKKHEPLGEMPAYEGKIAPATLEAIVDYLSQLH